MKSLCRNVVFKVDYIKRCFLWWIKLETGSYQQTKGFFKLWDSVKQSLAVNSSLYFCFPCLTFPLLFLWGAAGLEVFRDVSVGEVLKNPLGEGQRLHLVCGNGVAQDGSAQVAQAGHSPGCPPEPYVAVSGSVSRGEVALVAVNHSGSSVVEVYVE